MVLALPHRGRLAGLLTALALVLSAGPSVAAKPRDAVSASDLPLIKAALVYNLSKFVEWPPERQAGDFFVVGTLGHGDGDPDFASLIGKTLQGRTLQVVTVTDTADLATCHVLYVSTEATDEWAAMREADAVNGLFTVSDSAGFAAAGGVAELIFDDARLRFVINKAAARSGHLTVSSQVLKIAMSVIDDE